MSLDEALEDTPGDVSVEDGRHIVAALAALLRDPRLAARAAETLGDVSVEDFVHHAEDLVELSARAQRAHERLQEDLAALGSRSAAVRRRAVQRAEQQEAQDAEDAAWMRAKRAELGARLSPEDQLAAWRVADQCPVLEARLVRLVSRLTRWWAQWESVAGWRTWLAMLGERLLSAVARRSQLPAWAPARGRAPPGTPAIITRQ